MLQKALLLMDVFILVFLFCLFCRKAEEEASKIKELDDVINSVLRQNNYDPSAYTLVVSLLHCGHIRVGNPKPD